LPGTRLPGARLPGKGLLSTGLPGMEMPWPHAITLCGGFKLGRGFNRHHPWIVN
jgi:hypothetical protein